MLNKYRDRIYKYRNLHDFQTSSRYGGKSIQDKNEDSIARHAYGGVFQARLDYVRQRHGKRGLEKLLAHAKKNGYSGPMNRDDFKIAKPYPLEYLLVIMHSYIDLFGERNFDRMSREAAKRRGIVGFLVKWAGSPDLLLSKAQEYWPKFYDFGGLEGEVLGKNKGLVRGYDVSPEPMFCRSLGNYFIGIFDNLRLKSIYVNHLRCVHRGDEFCEWELAWSK